MYKIYTMKIAESTEPEARVLYLGDCSKTVEMYSYFWLVKGNSRTVLVDTGFNLEDAKTMNSDIKQTREEHPLSQLSKRNVRPDEITDIIITHVHWDHLSPMIDNFMNADIYVQEKDIKYVLDPPHPWFSQFVFVKTVKKLTSDFKTRVHLIDGEKDILPGISVFLAGGHTPGSQVVKVRTELGNVIISGDAVFTYKNISEDIPVGFNSNLEECFSAMRRIREEADIVLPGHDPLVLARYEEI